MSNPRKHLILRYLDAPYRLGFLSFTDFTVLFVPIAFFGGILNRIFLGILLSGVLFFGYRKLMKFAGEGHLASIFYWYFPHNKMSFPKAAKSCIREYVG